MTEQTTIKEQSHAKMLDEMSKPHSAVLDHIHNWLCSQTDEELLTGILKQGKSIKSALNVLMSAAKKQKVQVMSDEEGFQIISEYFKSDEKEVAQPDGVDTKDNRPKYIPPVVTPEEKVEQLEVARKQNEERNAKQEQENADKKLAAEKKRGVGMISIFDFIDDPISTQAEVEEVKEEGDDDDELSDGDDE